MANERKKMLMVRIAVPIREFPKKDGDPHRIAGAHASQARRAWRSKAMPSQRRRLELALCDVGNDGVALEHQVHKVDANHEGSLSGIGAISTGMWPTTTTSIANGHRGW